MKINIVNYKKEHAYSILHRNVEEGSTLAKNFEEIAEAWEHGQAYTAIYNETPIFCGGVVDIGWHRGEMWMLTSSLFYKFPLACFKICKNKADEFSSKYKRVQVTSFMNKKHIKFIERLGFNQEGLLKSYGPNNEDVIMFSRIQECKL